MKTCFRCHKSKPLSDFYAHSMMKDGHLNKCKSCAKNDSEERRAVKMKDPLWELAERERHRKKQQAYREQGRACELTGKAKTEVNQRYIRKFPSKQKARILAQRLPKNPCEICGNPKSQKHHEDYSKPLDVRWLCAKHHAARHVELRKELLLNPLLRL